MTIKFGTDGWRAVISDTFTFANLRLVAQAIADFVLEQNSSNPSVVVGFDTRFLSDRYAVAVAEVLAAHDIDVWLTQADAPTPMVSHAIVDKQADGGVMITASHNPPRYNGIKLKSAHGGSASVAHVKQVEARLKAEPNGDGPAARMPLDEAIERGRVRRFNPLPAYQEHLRSPKSPSAPPNPAARSTWVASTSSACEFSGRYSCRKSTTSCWRLVSRSTRPVMPRARTIIGTSENST